MSPSCSLLRKSAAPVAALVLLLAAGAAGGSIYVKAPDEHLVDTADLIVRAVVYPLERPPVRQGLPRTHFRLEVTAGLRGAAAGEILEMVVPGGSDGAGRTAIVSASPSFRDGEEALLFLDRDDGRLLRPVHLEQGVYRLPSLDGQKVAWRRLGAGAPHADGSAEEERPRDLVRFEAWIGDRLAGRSRSADYFAEAPAEGLESAPTPYNLWTAGGDLPVRWRKSVGRLDLTFATHERPQPGLAGGGYDEVRTALDAWTNLPDGLLRLRHGGNTSSTAGFHRNDGINAIVFDNYGAAKPDLQPFDCASGRGYLGYAIVWRSGSHFYAGREFLTIVGADAVTNDNFDCWSGFGSLNFEFILAHEIGHMLGLAHACEFGNCPGPDEAASVMHNRSPDNVGARLSADDRRAIAYLYGPPSAPGRLRAESAGERRVELVWEDASDNEIAFVVHRVKNGERREIGRTGPGITRFTDEAAEPETVYVYEVRAENENGASAAAEASVVTAGAAAPGQLRAIEAGPDFLTLAWVDRTNTESGFEVWGRFAGPDELLASLPANSTTARIEGLIADTVYHLKVRAVGLPVTGNTAFSSTVTAGTRPAPIGRCSEGPSTACLGAERFQLEVRWKDFAGQRGEAQVAPAGSADSGIFYFFSPDNWEMLVKVLDGCAINQKHWVFAAATTDVETTLIVTDSLTGSTAVYWSPAGTPAPAITDIEAFAGCPETTASQRSAPVDLQSLQRTPTTPEPPTSFPRKRESSLPPPPVAAGCDGTLGNLCLQGGRYDVSVTWNDFAGVSGSGKAVPAGTADSGLFTFFSPDNWEMLVKVLDGCAINQKHWVFAAATTNVAYTLTVTDTATGVAKSYENLLGQASPAITDILAFDACPDP